MLYSECIWLSLTLGVSMVGGLGIKYRKDGAVPLEGEMWNTAPQSGYDIK